MQWERLICNKRLGMERYRTSSAQTRSDFQRDFDRLVFSSPFRRLQNKTQVFPLPGSIFVHNRLTHSLEVSSVGKSLANEVYIQLQPKYAGTAAAEKNGMDPIRRSHRIQERIFTARRSAATDIHATGRAL